MKPRNRNLPKLGGEIVGGKIPMESMEGWYETVTEKGYKKRLSGAEWDSVAIEQLWATIRENYNKGMTRADCIEQMSEHVIDKQWSGINREVLQELIDTEYESLDNIQQLAVEEKKRRSKFYGKAYEKARGIVEKMIAEEKERLGRDLTKEEIEQLRKERTKEALTKFFKEEFDQTVKDILNSEDEEEN